MLRIEAKEGTECDQLAVIIEPSAELLRARARKKEKGTAVSHRQSHADSQHVLSVLQALAATQKRFADCLGHAGHHTTITATAQAKTIRRHDPTDGWEARNARYKFKATEPRQVLCAPLPVPV